MSLAQALERALELHVPERLRPAMADLRDEVLRFAGLAQDDDTLTHQIEALVDWVEAQFTAIEQLHGKASDFNVGILNAPGEKERHTLILDLAERLGADRRQLDRDAKALDAFFDADAVLERYRRRVGERERALAYGFERLGELAASGLAAGAIDPHGPLLTEWIAELTRLGKSYRGDARVRAAAHRCVHLVAKAGHGKLAGFWLDLAIQDAQRCALSAEDDAWAQCEALATLRWLSAAALKAVLERRLGANADGGTPLALDNRLFVRRFMARLLLEAAHDQPNLARQIQRLANDPAGAVRQALAVALPLAPADMFGGLYARLRVDQDPQVQAALFLDPSAMLGAAGSEAYVAHLLRVFARPRDEFVVRMAIAATAQAAQWHLENEPEALGEVVRKLREGLAGLRARSENLRIRRWAGVAAERLWLIGEPEARMLAGELRTAIAGQKEGSVRRMPALRGLDDELVGRVLAVLASEDFGFDYRPGRRPRLQRGDRFTRRLWRFLFELRNSATDKRQAWLHTIGRSWSGPIAAPSFLLGELAPTKVPGEPLFQAQEGGWRNHLPLLDHVLSAIDRGGETRLFTSEGVTTIAVPRGFWRRLSAFLGISRNFATIAALRNQAGNDFALALRARGIDLRFAPHPDPDTGQGQLARDPEVTRLFDLGGVLLTATALWSSAQTYFATVYQNTLPQLAVFLALASAFFVGRHVWQGQRMRWRRDRIALVLGGWGTRGKSGTERLKAGLINAIGLPLVSKTTGCEAMFLHGTAFGDLREMFLFRPYDKATIWEQYDLIGVTRGLGARAFLWECMGLTPSYVRVLQKDWMRDDISTITNTYPDHEDVQGPAGRNIPEVMTQFIPDRGTLLTTEEVMLPILREAAETFGTRVRPVAWKEAGMVHQDLLERFPYAEHPSNIALVIAMADELGLGADYAVKEMADRVVADLGVLKTYPRAAVEGRTLEFVMGMSANERFGAMGNWDRMGFAAHDLARDPEIFISTVVNNRADRVPRSRVFARILVEDVAADRHVLIGSNIDGLMGFIAECWDEHAAKLSLFDGDGEPLERLRALARQQRVPLDAAQIAGRLRAMLAAHADLIDPDAAVTALEAGKLGEALAKADVAHRDEISAHIAAMQEHLAGLDEIAAALSRGGDHGAIDAQMRGFLRGVFMAKLVPVHDYYMPGEAIVRLVAQQTPPGLINRIMGMQNIKGTGLDWVYRWQAWEACHKACLQTRDRDPGIARKGLDFLGGFQEYGVLSEQLVRETIADLRANGGSAAPGEAELNAVLARLESQMAELAADTGDDKASGSSGGRLNARLEALLDSTDAVLRRRGAERIYRAMIAEQISSQRAALELKKLTARQKGGWLGTALANTRARFAIRSAGPG
jgi:gamma-polyglutamate synthase